MAPLGKHRQSLGVPRKKLGGSDTTVQGGKPPITLKLWIIRFVSGGVVVEGYKALSDNDATQLQNWRSTPIAVRIDSKTVQTHSGSIYKLKGGIEEDEAAEAGIPEELIDEFASGFPENWEELIREHLHDEEMARRRQSMNTATTIDTERDEEEERRTARRRSQRGPQEETMDTGEASDDEERLRDAKKRRSMQKGRQSMMHRVQPGTPIEEEDEEEEITPARGKTPGRKNKTGETPLARGVDKKTPRGRGRTSQEDEEMEERKKEEKTRVAPSTSRGRTTTPRGGKMTPKGRVEEEDEDEVFATPDEIPPVRARNLSVAIPQQRKEEEKTPHRPPSFGFTHGRVSLDAIPKEIMEKSIPLTRWVFRFVRGGTDKSIFPHFQFKILGFRPECEDQEWTTSAIQKVVPPYIMFTSSSIYRLDGQMDVDQASDIGFPRSFIHDFLLGFPDDWDERLELFFNKTFGPPPQPKIVEVMSDGGTVDDENKNKKKELGATPRNGGDGQNNRPNAPNFDLDDFEPLDNRKRKEPTPSSASSGEESDEEEVLRREARKLEKEMRRAEKAAELRAKAKEEKKKRFEVKVNTTPDGVAISRSGRTLRKPMAKWAGENVTYDVHGNVVDITGVTTTTKMTVGKTNEQQAEKLAAHFGLDSPLNSTMQKERAIAPPTACLPKTPAPKKSKADYKGYSDDETGGIHFKDYVNLLAKEDMATPAFILKKGKRRCRAVESSDSEAEAEERRKEEKRRKKEERRRLRESEEEEESSDGGWRRKKKSKGKKKVTVKKEKQVKRAPSKKRKAKESEEEGMGSDLEIEHDPDAVSFILSDEGSNVERGNGYSDNEEIQSEEEEEEQPSKKKSQKKTVKRAKVWKKEELTRLKLAIQAANPSGTPEGWENVAKSLGGERTAEECKKSAIERLKMKFNEPTMAESDGEYGSERAWSGAESGAASEDEEKKNRRNARLDEGNAVKGISAKPGTIAHAQEMEAMKRERLLGGRQSQDDFFKNTKTRMSGVAALPSVAVFDPDDSLLEALDDDDVAPAPKQRTTKTAKMAAAPATPRLAALSSFDDSPGGSATTSARRSSAKFVPSPVVNQNDLTRYVHQLSRTKNMSMLSKSAIDQSRMMPPPLARGRMVARAAEAIDKGVSKVEKMKNGRRRDQMGDLDEDDENHDDILTGI